MIGNKIRYENRKLVSRINSEGEGQSDGSPPLSNDASSPSSWRRPYVRVHDWVVAATDLLCYPSTIFQFMNLSDYVFFFFMIIFKIKQYGYL